MQDLDVQDQNMTAALYCELARLLVQNGTNTELRIDTTRNGSITQPPTTYPLLFEDGADPSPKMGLQGYTGGLVRQNIQDNIRHVFVEHPLESAVI